MLIGAHIRNFGVLHDTVVGVSFSELASMATQQAADLHDPAVSPVPGNRLPLSQINALIGRNSTGKSALFSALSFVHDCLLHDIAFACEQNGRRGFTSLKTVGDESDICFSLVFAGLSEEEFLCYDLCLSSDKHGRPFAASEAVCRAWFNGGGFSIEPLLTLEKGRGTVRDSGELQETAVTATKAPALAAYGLLTRYPLLNLIHDQISRWFFDKFFRPGNQPQRAEPDRQGGHRHVSVSGDNVRNVLEFLQLEHPEHYEQAIARIAERMPDEKRIDQAIRNGISASTRKLFTLLLLLEDPNPRPLLCLEEPDGGLYHDMVDSLAFALRDYTIRNPDCQVMFTTHSPYILESMRPEEVWVFERKPAASIATAAASAARMARRQASVSGEAAAGPATLPGESASALAAGTATHAPFADPYTHTRNLARDPVVRAMHAQGVGLGAMWYSGHLDRSWDELHGSGGAD